MKFKKGDIIHNNVKDVINTQQVKILSEVKPNYEHGSSYEYPYRAKVLHVNGNFTGEIIEGYYISKDSILIKSSDEFFNKIIKPFDFA